jgi:hypothetical protein
MSWMVRRRSWRPCSWMRATFSGVVQHVGLPVCSSSSTDVRPVLNRACHWNTCVRLKSWSLKACWIIVRFSAALLPRLAQKVCTLAFPFSEPSWKSPQVTYMNPNKRVRKLPTSTQLCATWHADLQEMVFLPSTGASRYYNCCIDGCISPEYFG